MTAAELNNLAAELKTATLEVQGATDQVTLTGLTFDYNAPLPPLNIAPRERLWEPAAVRFRDLPGVEA
jgi:hypothetical protein